MDWADARRERQLAAQRRVLTHIANMEERRHVQLIRGLFGFFAFSAAWFAYFGISALATDRVLVLEWSTAWPGLSGRPPSWASAISCSPWGSSLRLDASRAGDRPQQDAA